MLSNSLACMRTYKLTHLLTYLLILSLIHLLTHLLRGSFAQLLTLLNVHTHPLKIVCLTEILFKLLCWYTDSFALCSKLNIHLLTITNLLTFDNSLNHFWYLIWAFAHSINYLLFTCLPANLLIYAIHKLHLFTHLVTCSLSTY